MADMTYTEACTEIARLVRNIRHDETSGLLIALFSDHVHEDDETPAMALALAKEAITDEAPHVGKPASHILSGHDLEAVIRGIFIHREAESDDEVIECLRIDGQCNDYTYYAGSSEDFSRLIDDIRREVDAYD